jgi:hypothetical protein
METCFSHILPMPSASRKHAPISVLGQGQTRQGWTSGRHMRLCPPPSTHSTKHGFCYTPPVFVSSPVLVLIRRPGRMGSCWARVPAGAAFSLGARPRKLRPHQASPPGSGFRDSLGQQIKLLPQLRNWKKALMLCMALSLFLFFKKKNSEIYQICVNEVMLEGGQFCFMFLRRKTCGLTYIYTHRVYSHIYPEPAAGLYLYCK